MYLATDRYGLLIIKYNIGDVKTDNLSMFDWNGCFLF